MFSPYFTHDKPSSHQAYASFSLRPAPWDPRVILVYPANHPVEAPPMYSTMISKDSTPNVVVARGWGGTPWDGLGEARLPSMSSKVHLILHGQSMDMRLNQISANFTLETPAMGRLKWKLDMLTGRNMELHDVIGQKLAKLRPAKNTGEKVLEILVSHDSGFFELVLLSGLTARSMNKSMTEATGEILTAVLGA
jgi:hypothetical protein